MEQAARITSKFSSFVLSGYLVREIHETL